MIRKLLKNEYLYSVVTKMIVIGLSLLQSILVARYLGASIQGTNTSITSIVAIASIIITFGMHQAYPYYRKKHGKDAIYEDFISIIATVFLGYAVIAVLLSTLILRSFELQMAALLTPIHGFSRVVGYVYLIECPNKRNTWWTIISILDILLVLGLLLFTQRSAVLGVLILAFAEVLKAVVYSVLLRVRIRWHKGIMRFYVQLMKIGFFPMVALLMTNLNYKIDVLMLRGFSFITKAEIGVYGVGISFADKIAIIPDTLKGVLVSKLAKGAGEKEVAKVCRLCFWVSILICIAILAVGKPMITFLYGEEYSEAYRVMLFCAFGSVFIGYFKLIAQYNIVNKKQIRNVLLLSGSILLNVILNYLLIPKYRLAGAAFASGMGYFATSWIFIIWFAKSSGLRLSEMFILQKEDLSMLKTLGRKVGK